MGAMAARDFDRACLLSADVGEPLRVIRYPPERWLLTTYANPQIDETTTHGDVPAW
jgi:hypothetical protein